MTTDKNVGLSNIYYKVNGGDFKPFLGAVKGFKKNKKYELTIKAVDLLGNEALETIQFYIGK